MEYQKSTKPGIVQMFSMIFFRFLCYVYSQEDNKQEVTKKNARKKLPNVPRQDRVGTSMIIGSQTKKIKLIQQPTIVEKKVDRKDQTKTPAQLFNIVERKDQIKTLAQLSKNPYLKEDAIKYFRIKDKNEMYYSIKQADIKIQQQLLKMSQHGFDMKTIDWKFQSDNSDNRRRRFNSKKPFKEFNRKIYALFKCPKCINNFGSNKQWISILGNFEIKFDVADLQQFWQEHPEYREKGVNLNKMRYPSIVKRQMKMYMQKCVKCNGWGEPYIFQSQLKACTIQFCRIVADILNLVQPPTNVGDRNKEIDVHNHIQQLCQACMKGKCFNIPKSQTRQIRRNEV